MKKMIKKRLELRAEKVRVLATSTLAEVQGGNKSVDGTTTIDGSDGIASQGSRTLPNTCLESGV